MVTLRVDELVANPCSWSVGLSVPDPTRVTVALDCRVVPSEEGGCWTVRPYEEMSVFTLQFSGACCERLLGGRVGSVDVAVECAP
jgi:hypothetical protein